MALWLFKDQGVTGFTPMPKCIICGGLAEFQIKGTSNYYCRECAEQMFNDTRLLLKVEKEAERLKMFVKEVGSH